MKIKNFHHLNQFVLSDWSKDYFQSYQSMICKVAHDKSELTFWCDWDYSITTLKHLYMFLYEYVWIDGLNKKSLQKAIDEWSITNWYINYKIVYDTNL